MTRRIPEGFHLFNSMEIGQSAGNSAGTPIVTKNDRPRQLHSQDLP